ncbi:ParB/RepB/Spo0J family partition protein [Desulfovibrio ferrophilus]|uniref:ParB-like partition protein n=1 Tax=Desulfovibrio ferrophilus TaxID=241368 RepID=A0A2Z6B1N1_9BACT|nr:ParB/RepB/Spo0J family partition protein [Desulfovibrio ferrophilus]BBD09381.1 ParB-like partition protein [Desulfovibrio ferrophilus]
MASAQRGLGRGLDALLSGFGDDPSAPEVVLVPIDKIRANPNQPRRDFEVEALNELADSIRTSGILQPILVRPIQGEEFLYELVAGERRWRASQIAEQPEMPAIVRHLDDQETLAIALIENLQREDLNPIEEALGLKRLQEQFDLTQEDLAERVGKSRSAIANTLRLTQLPDAIQMDIRRGNMSAGHGRSLLAVSDAEAQEEFRMRVLNKGMSVREAEAMAAYWKRTGDLPGDNGTPTIVRKPGAPKPVSNEVLELGRRITHVVGAKAMVSGALNKGQIILKYGSPEELNVLLNLLGVNEPEIPAVPEEDGPEVPGIAEMLK